MLTQRWRLRRSLSRPANEVINIREYEVTAIPGRPMVESSMGVGLLRGVILSS